MKIKNSIILILTILIFGLGFNIISTNAICGDPTCDHNHSIGPGGKAPEETTDIINSNEESNKVDWDEFFTIEKENSAIVDILGYVILPVMLILTVLMGLFVFNPKNKFRIFFIVIMIILGCCLIYLSAITSTPGILDYTPSQSQTNYEKFVDNTMIGKFIDTFTTRYTGVLTFTSGVISIIMAGIGIYDISKLSSFKYSENKKYKTIVIKSLILSILGFLVFSSIGLTHGVMY